MSFKSSICGPAAADCPSRQNLNFISNLVQFSSSRVLQAACHKERHVSQKAVSFIHDVLTEVLTSWAELPHFHFNEALFRPFEHIMQLELCDEDVQDQVGGVFLITAVFHHQGASEHPVPTVVIVPQTFLHIPALKNKSHKQHDRPKPTILKVIYS